MANINVSTSVADGGHLHHTLDRTPQSPSSNDDSFEHHISLMSIKESRVRGSGGKDERSGVDEWSAAMGSDGIYFYNTRTKEMSWRLPPSVTLHGDVSTGFRFLEGEEADSLSRALQTPPSLDAQRRQNELKIDYGASRSLVTIFDSVTNSPATPSSEIFSPSDHSSDRHDDSIKSLSRSKVKSNAPSAEVLFCFFCSDAVRMDSYIKHVRGCQNRTPLDPIFTADLLKCLNVEFDSPGKIRRSASCKENFKVNANRRKAATLPAPTPGRNLREDANNGRQLSGKVDHIRNVCPLCKYRATSERNDFSRHLRECVLHADLSDSDVNFAISQINTTSCPFCYHPPTSAGLSAHLDKCPKRLDCLKKFIRR